MSITIKALISKLEIETKIETEKNNLENLLDIQEDFKRFSILVEKVNLLIEKKLLEKAENLLENERFKIGLREFEKVQEYTIAKLDETLLSQMITDQDNLNEFYKKVPKTQKEIQELLNTFGIKTKIDQIYIKEPKGTFKIKFKN
jgi:HD-GYP domain-containing protein (c-di-GMP phosphodiesterase class II)